MKTTEYLTVAAVVCVVVAYNLFFLGTMISAVHGG